MKRPLMIGMLACMILCLPGIVVAQAAPKADKEKTALLKKLSNLLSFRKHAVKRQQQLIDKTLTDLNFPDSIKVSSLKLKEYIDTLSSAELDRYQRLSLQIDSLIKVTGTAQPATSSPQPAAPVPKPDVEQEPTDDATGNIIGVTLASKEAEAATDDKEKRQTLSLIRQVAARQQETRDSLHNGQQNKYLLQKKIEICGYYNAGSAFSSGVADFRFISTVIYDSLYTTNRQGSILKLRNWQNDDLIQQAKKAGSSVVYTILFSDKSNLGAFLSDRKAIENFAGEVNALRKDNNADGININFANLASYNRDLFTEFIHYIDELTGRSSSFRIYITLPVFDAEKAYDIASLAPLADRFCISFTSNLSSQSAPLSPLNGKERTSVATSVSYYLNQQVSPDKFILNFGYEGVKWLIHLSGDEPDRFIQYLTYAAIRNKTYATVMYDEVTQSAYIDTSYPKSKAIVRTWFDDEHTLSSKYDFILQNGLGGVGFSYFGYDGTYGELRDVLLYKFIGIDSAGAPAAADTSLTFFGKLKYKFSLYHYILHNPCATCFDSTFGVNPKNDSLRRYIAQLGIDSAVSSYNEKMRQLNKEKDMQHQELLMTSFTYLTKELNNLFLVLSSSLLFLVLLSAFFYLYYSNRKGDRWRYKKAAGWTVVALCVFFFWSLFDYLFTNTRIPFFGVSKSSYQALDVNGNVLCLPSENCINIPVNTLLEIILLAGIIGFALTRYLISPLLRKEEIP